MSRKRKHKRSPKRDRKIDDVQMTPMIDVVFQLLIYFVFTFEIPDILSRMEVYRPAPDRSPPPSQTDPRSHRIGVYVSPRGEGVFTYNDSQISRDRLARRMSRIADASPEQSIIVIATATSFHRDLVHVLNLLEEAGLRNVVLLSAD